MLLAGDALRLSTVTADQLTAAAGFLARALARFPDNAPRDTRKFDTVGRLEVAGKAIGAELARRAFTPRTDERLQTSGRSSRVAKWFHAEINCFNRSSSPQRQS